MAHVRGPVRGKALGRLPLSPPCCSIVSIRGVPSLSVACHLYLWRAIVPSLSVACRLYPWRALSLRYVPMLNLLLVFYFYLCCARSVRICSRLDPASRVPSHRRSRILQRTPLPAPQGRACTGSGAVTAPGCAISENERYYSKPYAG